MQRVALVCASLVLVACSGDDGGRPDAGRQTDGGPITGDPPGLISVASSPELSAISLTGAFQDGPSLEIRSETSRVGACRLMAYAPSFCDPACSSSELCVEGACVAFPARLDRGALDWSYPGGQMTVDPDGTLLYSASSTVSAHGTTEVTVAGETLSVETSPAPIPEADWSQALDQRSGDVVLRWTNPIAGARVRLSMTDCVGSHGGTGEVEIECEAADDGELVLPDAFLTALEGGDWSRGECGSHRLSRHAVDDAADGTFRLEAVAAAGFFYFPRE